jgi:hypothetical protein
MISHIDVPLARKVADMAEAGHVLRHCQSRWFAMPGMNTPSPAGVATASAREIRNGVIKLEDIQRCGTSACLAGFTCLVTCPEGTAYDFAGGVLRLPDGRKFELSGYAGQQLGLDAGQAISVFHEMKPALAIARLREYADRAEEYQDA